MNLSRLAKVWLITFGLLSLQGCAVSETSRISDETASELSSENLDLLFATEFPVASKDEALQKASRAYRERERAWAEADARSWRSARTSSSGSTAWSPS